MKTSLQLYALSAAHLHGHPGLLSGKPGEIAFGIALLVLFILAIAPRR